MALATTLKLILAAIETGSGGLGTATNEVSKDYGDVLATGTGLDQADLIFTNSYNIANGANQDLDLSGVLTNPFGGAVNFARIKAIIIKLRTTTAGYTINVGAGSNPLAALTNAISVRAGGLLVLWAPDATAYAVTAGTGDILRIANPNAAAVDVDVILIGASA